MIHVFNFLYLGLEWDNIWNADWMVPFVSVVKVLAQQSLRFLEKISMEDRHNIQTHTNYLAMLVCFLYFGLFDKALKLTVRILME